MPKRISEKDKKTFYYAYKLGKNSNNVYYGSILQGKGQFTSYNGARRINYYGEELEYNATLILQEDIKFIDNFTKIWFGITPNNVNEEATHKVIRVGTVVDGLYPIYLQSNVSNVNNLWYEYDGTILEIDAYFNYDTMTAKIPKSMYCPIDFLTNVWYSQPTDNNSVEDKIQLVYKEETNDSVILTFKEV